MTTKTILTHSQIRDLVWRLGGRIYSSLRIIDRPIKVYGIPRGGVPVCYLLEALQGIGAGFEIAESVESADCIVDDILDSGATADKWGKQHKKSVFPLVIKCLDYPDNWIVFPWEHNDTDAGEGIEDNVRRILQFVGEDPSREGLLETPRRVSKAWEHWCNGYKTDIPALLKTFKDGANGCDEMVIVKNIPFYSHCEHHLAPFFGTATIAYIPSESIVGLSKLPRVVTAFAHRLQVQERLTNQIADALQENLKPKGVGVIISARHLCMESRGICQQGHSTITSALRGVIRELPEARAEFLNLTK